MDFGLKRLEQNSSNEMKFLRSIKGCTILDKIRNDDMHRELKIFCIKDKIQEYWRISWTTSNICHADAYWEPHYTILHEEKETVEGPESVGLTKKPEQVYGLILEDDDNDD